MKDNSNDMKKSNVVSSYDLILGLNIHIIGVIVVSGSLAIGKDCLFAPDSLLQMRWKVSRKMTHFLCSFSHTTNPTTKPLKWEGLMRDNTEVVLLWMMK